MVIGSGAIGSLVGPVIAAASSYLEEGDSLGGSRFCGAVVVLATVLLIPPIKVARSRTKS